MAGAGEEDVLRLEVAVDDAALRGRRRAPSAIWTRPVERLGDGDPAARQPLAQGLALEQLGDEVGRAVVRADVVDRDDVRVVQRARRARASCSSRARNEASPASRSPTTLSATSRWSRVSRAR